MRILLINQYAGSPLLGMEFRPQWMARVWQRLGHEVLVVCGDQSHLRQSGLGNGHHLIEGVPYRVLRTLSYSENGLRRFGNMLTFRMALKHNRKELAGWRPDVVIASSTHPMDARPSLDLARRSGALFAFEVHDLWPLTPQLLGGFSDSHPMIQWMRREERLAYTHADLAVSLLPGTLQYMHDHGLRPGRWMYAPNGAEAEFAPEPAPAHIAKAISSLRVNYSTIIGHAGGMGTANYLGPVLETLPRLEELGAALVLIGDGNERAALVERFAHYPNVAFFDRIPRAQALGVLGLVDAGFISAAPSPLYEYGTSPNKVFDYMLVGLPILEFVKTPHAITSIARCGLQADPSVPDQIVRAAHEFISATQAQRESWSASGRAFVHDRGSQKVIATGIVNRLEQIRSEYGVSFQSTRFGLRRHVSIPPTRNES